MSLKPLLLLVLGLLICVGCASKYDATPKLPPGIIAPQSPHITFHGDVDFNPTERLELEKAAETWDAQTSGEVHIDIIWDLDFKDAIGLFTKQDDNLLVDISDPEVQAEIDCKASGEEFPCVPAGRVLGQTRSDIHQTYPIRLFMMSGRTTGPWFRKVAIHEFGHALGLDHIGNTTAIMFFASSNPETCDDRPSCSNICLKALDLNMFCDRTNGCKPADMKPCE